jgi:hypothetical protein
VFDLFHKLQAIVFAIWLIVAFPALLQLAFDLAEGAGRDGSNCFGNFFAAKAPIPKISVRSAGSARGLIIARSNFDDSGSIVKVGKR